MGWTKQQQQAIDTRGKNLLVSAAAGSGKTAVLVERIIKMVCEENYDIDKILVVTFTKAAAAEMKERIGNRLLAESVAHPENRRMQEQLSYIHRAPISTIHSFCTGLLRNHFHLISLDPGFRIGEEGETALLKQQVLESVLEEAYDAREEDFLRFAEAYSYGKDDRAIEEMILELFQYSTSHPMPEQWLREAVEVLEMDGKEPVWLKSVMEYSDRILKDAIANLERALEISYGEGILIEKYVPFLLLEKEMVEKALAREHYEERQNILAGIKYKSSPIVKTKDPLLKKQHEAAKKLRDQAKNMVNKLKQDCYQMTMEQIRDEAGQLKPHMNVLIRLVLQFSDKYMKCKQEKNLLEFGDLEHLTLKLLIADYKDGVVTKTPLARELSARYQAVFTDEYQDSNLIQEVLLKAVSREEEGNRFMVGDIKQSIYRFRMARPEIFLEKYALGEGGGLNENVELCNNFRSQPEVLYAINYIFYQIMKPSLGDVLYEKKAALTPPEEKTEQLEKRIREGSMAYQELWLVDLEKEDKKDADREESKVELEARLTAKRILECRQKYGCAYKDMVILLRTMAGWSDIFEEVLTLEGIPVHTETRRGYFDTFEIRVLLNMLAVVDNIYQDIPMAAVLRSPVGEFSGEELAQIRSLVTQERRKEDSLYDEMLFYLEKGSREEIKNKIKKVLELLYVLREEKTRLSLPELIWSLLEKTDYYHLVGSMPNGEQRMANIRMFLEKAAEYEKTSFKGVFHFIQYMEQIRSYDIDYGEASVLGEEADVVRIMSIHKSKGLEFPIVFLSGMGKKFNLMDRTKRMLLHPETYVGLDCIDLSNRVKYPSQQKKIISRQITLASLGEELRVLYVAMTRARDKLIMTGVVDDFHKKLKNCGEHPEAAFSFVKMAKADSYLDWIFPALCRSHCMDAFRESHGIGMPETEYFFVEGEPEFFDVQVVSGDSLVTQEALKSLTDRWEQKELFEFLKGGEDSLKIKKMQEAFSWEYPKKSELKARSKWSVSQLKEGTEIESPADIPKVPLLVPVKEDTMDSLQADGMDKPGTVPAFLREKEEKNQLSGAGRGTVVHKLMEEMSFAKADEYDLQEEIDRLIRQGKFREEYRDIVPMGQMRRFLSSPIGKRIIRAEKENRLYKEAQFMIGVPMKELEPETGSEETVLVQGIIDLYLEEGDDLVLLDYKTDYVEPGQEELLIERYRAQLMWYKRALEQMTGKKVKETLIYSFRLSGCLTVDKTEIL